ncbi:PucR family transcriptional regulator [Streptomyces malaysiensis]|uniref:PucR family transcriptional regulator n=1 Tax=Streptomyces malaysiensis TaxID=92644 RepID=UPI000BFF3007|nr:helix-turn-helix domain-containing protein [Streptomyces malaysiensis]ATL88513.1 transcriptional regulator, CdaR [Streptomyces malaysiensis]
MVGDGIQAVVDALATRLGRSVAVDDPAIRLIAASRHFGDEDALRVRSVLDRQIPAELQQQVLASGISDWTGPGILNGDGQYDFAPRLCCPVRCNGILLGFLWLIESVGTIDDVAPGLIALVEEAADAIAVLLYRKMLLHERERSQAESSLRLLLSPDREDRARAVTEIEEDSLLASTAHTAVLVAEIDRNPGEDATVALEAAAEYVERRLTPRSVLGFVRGRRLVLLVSGARPLGDQAARELAAQLRDRFFQLADSARYRCAVGVGGDAQGLEGAADSYRQATTAARAALLLPMFGDVTSWASLGPFALLLRIDLDQLTEDLPFPGVRDLLADPEQQILVSSLEEFLDRAGDVSRTAAALHVHRTTLYHRLKRVEVITGLDLDNGLDRLTLHLALKLSRLSPGRPS